MTTEINSGPLGEGSAGSMEVPTPFGQRRGHAFEVVAETLAPALARIGLNHLYAIFWTRRPRPDTPRVRHRGFWGGGDLQSKLAPSWVDTCQVESTDGLRFLALGELSDTCFGHALDVLSRQGRCQAALLWAPRAVALAECGGARGPLDSAGNELELVRRLGAEFWALGLIVVVPTGRFDDPTTGAMVFCPAGWFGTIPGLSRE